MNEDETDDDDDLEIGDLDDQLVRSMPAGQVAFEMFFKDGPERSWSSIGQERRIRWNAAFYAAIEEMKLTKRVSFLEIRVRKTTRVILARDKQVRALQNEVDRLRSQLKQARQSKLTESISLSV